MGLSYWIFAVLSIWQVKQVKEDQCLAGSLTPDRHALRLLAQSGHVLQHKQRLGETYPAITIHINTGAGII